ncbi:hypothetical protein [Paenibacillus jilunlii]|nr:hypothetical protein [Paenibacillus jilunlii]
MTPARDQSYGTGDESWLRHVNPPNARGHALVAGELAKFLL